MEASGPNDISPELWMVVLKRAAPADCASARSAGTVLRQAASMATTKVCLDFDSGRLPPGPLPPAFVPHLLRASVMFSDFASLAGLGDKLRVAELSPLICIRSSDVSPELCVEILRHAAAAVRANARCACLTCCQRGDN
ncbi:hypothetical protein WJX81_007806 [Elliptochloris bilobata]|uniref:Uncharacterized protein n=1 Tax=Elliptochloris bilobata TaxID=381761 RepID=A0AAW1RLP1_9CHLO